MNNELQHKQLNQKTNLDLQWKIIFDQDPETRQESNILSIPECNDKNSRCARILAKLSVCPPSYVHVLRRSTPCPFLQCFKMDWSSINNVRNSCCASSALLDIERLSSIRRSMRSENSSWQPNGGHSLQKYSSAVCKSSLST